MVNPPAKDPLKPDKVEPQPSQQSIQPSQQPVHKPPLPAVPAKPPPRREGVVSNPDF